MNLRTPFLICILLAAGSPSRGKNPNILMIAVDDLRPMLGCYGDRRIRTPNIDRLASRGMLFERAYCQYAKCGTSRLSLMTGLRPDQMGVFSNNKNDLRRFRKKNPGIVSMGRWFKKHGFLTRSFGKIYHDGWDDLLDWSVPPVPGREGEMLEIADPNSPRGPTLIAPRLDCPAIQDPDAPDDHFFAGRMAEMAAEFLRSRSDSDHPYFLAVGFRRPHLPFVAPRRFFEWYRPDRSWLPKDRMPPKGVEPVAWFNSGGYGGSARKVGLTMPIPPRTRQQAMAWNGYELRSYQGVPNHGPIPDELQLRLIHAYAACVSYVDAQIGKLLQALHASGRAKSTVIVLWSDHGWHLGEHSAWGKMTNYEIATRVPLIFSGPGVARGKTTRSLAELVDVYPTLCALAGLEAPPHLEGDDLCPVLRNPSHEVKLAAQSQYDRYRGKYTGRAVRTKSFRHVVWYDAAGKAVAEELYHCEDDPGETNNLSRRFR